MPNIKEIALKVAEERFPQLPEEVLDFAEALIAEIAKGNEPVAWWNGKETAFFEHEVDGPVGEVRIPLYTLPPTAEQIANETAEAWMVVIKKMEANYDKDIRDGDLYKATACEFIAKSLRSGAWKEFKKL